MSNSTGRRVAFYGRLSLDTEASVSEERQAHEVREYAARKGYRVVLEAFDGNVRASKVPPEKREGWQKIMAAGEADQIDAVLVWAQDRLVRSSLDWHHVEAWLREHDIKFGTVHGDLDLDDPMGEFQAGLMAQLGRLEARQLGARAASARKELIAQGRRPGGVRPWPFRKADNPNGPGVVLRPIPERAEAVRWVRQWILDGGSWHSACRELNDRGLVPERGKFWHVSPMRRMMSNVALCGGSTYHGAIVRNQDGTIRVDPDQAILSIEEWLELKRLIEGRGVLTRRSAIPTLLFGLAICDTCNRPLHHHRPTDTYRCTNQRCERQVSIRREPLDQTYEERWLSTLGEATQEPPEEPKADPLTIHTLTDQLQQLEREMLGDPDDDRLLELHRLRRGLRQQIKDLRAEVEATPRGKWEAWTDRRGETWRERYEKADSTASKNEVLRDMGAVVYVRPGPPGGRPKSIEERLDWRSW